MDRSRLRTTGVWPRYWTNAFPFDNARAFGLAAGPFGLDCLRVSFGPLL
jgi:hypothetical protein